MPKTVQYILPMQLSYQQNELTNLTGKNGFDCGNQLEHKVTMSHVLEAGAG